MNWLVADQQIRDHPTVKPCSDDWQPGEELAALSRISRLRATPQVQVKSHDTISSRSPIPGNTIFRGSNTIGPADDAGAPRVLLRHRAEGIHGVRARLPGRPQSWMIALEPAQVLRSGSTGSTRCCAALQDRANRWCAAEITCFDHRQTADVVELTRRIPSVKVISGQGRITARCGPRERAIVDAGAERTPALRRKTGVMHPAERVIKHDGAIVGARRVQP